MQHAIFCLNLMYLHPKTVFITYCYNSLDWQNFFFLQKYQKYNNKILINKIISLHVAPKIIFVTSSHQAPDVSVFSMNLFQAGSEFNKILNFLDKR